MMAHNHTEIHLHLNGGQQFKCLTGGGCVDSSKKCDGNPDCSDQSDESKIICGKAPFQLTSSSITSLYIVVLDANHLSQSNDFVNNSHKISSLHY